MIDNTPAVPRRHYFFGEQFGRKRIPEFARDDHSEGVGASPVRYRGLEQALGDKAFIDDMKLLGMLHASPVLTSYPRAKVLGIDTSVAAQMAGVVCVLTAIDVPGPRGTGLTIPDLPVFVAVGETTCCIGDMLALVVADTAFRARQAASKNRESATKCWSL